MIASSLDTPDAFTLILEKTDALKHLSLSDYQIVIDLVSEAYRTGRKEAFKMAKEDVLNAVNLIDIHLR